MSYSQNSHNNKATMRALMLITVIALVAVGVLGLKYSESNAYRSSVRAQLLTRIRTNCSTAKLLADKLPNSVQQDTASKLSQIRQCVYTITQLNEMAITLGGEGGRIVPEDAITALNTDMEEYFSITQSNTTSVLEIRTLLINHLTALQTVLSTIN